MIDHGHLVALDTPAALKRLVGQDVVSITTSDTERAATEASRWLERPARREQDVLYVEGENGHTLAASLIRHLTLADIEVYDVSVQAPSLDDVFVFLTGRAIREESVGAKERLGAHLRGLGRLRR